MVDYCYYYFHVTDEETELEKENDLLRVSHSYLIERKQKPRKTDSGLPFMGRSSETVLSLVTL